MKKTLNSLYRALCHTALAFTAVLFFFWLFMDSGNNDRIYYEDITEFFKFAAIFGLSSFLSVIPKIPAVLKTFLRFIVNTIAFVAFISVLGDGSQNARFVSIVLFVIIYVIVTVTAIVIEKLLNRKTNEDVRAETTQE